MVDDNPIFSVLLTSVVTGGLGLLAGWFLGRKGPLPVVSKLPSIKPLSGRTKLVLVVRTDLKMGNGKIAAQCSHATLSCYQEAIEVNPGIVQTWEKQGQPKIVVRTESYDDMLLLQAKADSIGLVNSIVHDAGHTQVPAGTATVLGIGPGKHTGLTSEILGLASEIDRVTGDLKLL